MKKIILFVLPLMVMCFVSCEKESRTPYFNPHSYKEEGYINAFGGQGYCLYTYKSDASYNYNIDNVIVTCDKPSWFEYTYEVSFSNGQYIDVRIDYHITESNETGESREVTVLIQFDSDQQHKITFTQPGFTEVIVSTPGTLIQELADNELLYALSLKISGELNDKDLETIKGLREISTLDLTDAVIDDLPDEMFYQNETIRNIKLPKSITTIHPKTFAFSSLEYIYFPSNIEVIEDGETNYNNSYNWYRSGAFANTNLRTIEFATDSKLRYIGDYAFVAAGEEYYSSYSNTYSYTFDVIFPASVEKIGSDVFSYNSRGNTVGVDYELRKAYIRIAFAKNSELTSIGSISNREGISIDASNCAKVKYVGSLSGNSISVKIGTQIPPQCGGVSLSSPSGLGHSYLSVPKGCVGAYYDAEGWKEFDTIKEIE